MWVLFHSTDIYHVYFSLYVCNIDINKQSLYTIAIYIYYAYYQDEACSIKIFIEDNDFRIIFSHTEKHIDKKRYRSYLYVIYYVGGTFGLALREGNSERTSFVAVCGNN